MESLTESRCAVQQSLEKEVQILRGRGVKVKEKGWVRPEEEARMMQ